MKARRHYCFTSLTDARAPHEAMAVERLEAAQSAHGAMTVAGGSLLTRSGGRGCGTLHAFRILVARNGREAMVKVLVAGERLAAQ